MFEIIGSDLSLIKNEDLLTLAGLILSSFVIKDYLREVKSYVCFISWFVLSSIFNKDVLRAVKTYVGSTS